MNVLNTFVSSNKILLFSEWVFLERQNFWLRPLALWFLDSLEIKITVIYTSKYFLIIIIKYSIIQNFSLYLTFYSRYNFSTQNCFYINKAFKCRIQNNPNLNLFSSPCAILKILSWAPIFYHTMSLLWLCRLRLVFLLPLNQVRCVHRSYQLFLLHRWLLSPLNIQILTSQYPI